ncbi:MAG: DUF262 domain-containing protein [Myxococcota bacterium]
MNNNVLTVEQLFSERLFSIPAYQRGYAWEGRHRSEFLQDLELLPEGKDHYTGTVVLHSSGASGRVSDEEGRSYGTFDVVDGQQRLTTTVLLLDAIHKAFSALPGKGKFADGVRKSYVMAQGFDGQPLLRLRLNPDCRAYWEEVVLASKPSPTAPTIQSHRRLRDGQAQFAGYLADQRASRGNGWEPFLLGLYRKVTQQLKFSLYEVGATSDVGVIFETMNNRGKPLSELEKVKNYLLYMSSKVDVEGHDLADRVNAAWADIFEHLMAADLTGADDENQVLRCHWLTAYNHDRRTWNGSQGIKDRFPLSKYAGSHKKLLDDLQSYTRSLRDVAVAYADAANPGRTGAFASYGTNAPEIQRLSEKLLRMRVLATFLPLLVGTRLRYPGDAKKYLAVVDFCERFAFRVYRLLGTRANAGQSRLFQIGHQVYHGQVSLETALQQLYGALRYYCPDEDFTASLEEVEDWYSWYGLKYFLYEYEEHLAAGHAIKFSWAEVDKRDLDKTIEHILPQTPSDPYWKENFDLSDRRKYTDDIGNLVLTQHNGSLGAKAFGEKKGKPGQEKPCYVTSVLFQEQELGKYANWTPTNLLQRRKKIMKWAAERWAIPTPYRSSEAAAPSPAEAELDEE